MTDPWQRARELARMQATDEEIVGALVEDLAIDEAKALRFTSGDAAKSLLRAREAGKAQLRQRIWELAQGGKVMQYSGTEMAALQLVARAYLGMGEAHDVAQLREYLAEGKRRAKSGKGLKAVG